jgi:hypothetical protein
LINLVNHLDHLAVLLGRFVKGVFVLGLRENIKMLLDQIDYHLAKLVRFLGKDIQKGFHSCDFFKGRDYVPFEFFYLKLLEVNLLDYHVKSDFLMEEVLMTLGEDIILQRFYFWIS